jgi:outer membrane protein OmpA-like peptidoglycan-associated protein
MLWEMMKQKCCYLNLRGILLFLLVAWLFAPLSAQNLREQATVLFDAGKFKPALDLLLRYQEQKPGNLDVQRDIGIAAFHANQLGIARQYLGGLIDKSPDPTVTFYFGKVNQHEFQFKEAIRQYKNFLRKVKLDDPRRRATIADIKRCAAGQKIILSTEDALVENLGETINSAYDEFAPVVSPTDEDKLYFASSREYSEGGLRDDLGRMDDKNGKYAADIFSTYTDNGEWHEPTPLGNPLLSTSQHEFILSFDKKGTSMYLYRGLTQFSGDVLLDVFKQNSEQRTPPIPFISPIKANEGDNALCFFNDTLMIFASRRAGGYGGLDLYYSRFTEGAWSNPENLGPNINTSFDETTPFLAKDGRTLYFSSNSTQSMGGFDIFKSTYMDVEMSWQAAQNLGRPFNSVGDDTYFQLTADGRKGYFCSNRKDSHGERDIYQALFKTAQKVQVPSQPSAFYEVPAHLEKAKNGTISVGVTKVKYEFSPLYYDQDADLLRGSNMQQLKKVADLWKLYPNVQIILTGHSVETESVPFDLYFMLKRLEQTRKILTDNGVRIDNITLKSVGSGYPIALTILEGTPNPAGEKMNKRIDIDLKNTLNTPIDFQYNTPAVSELMVNKAGDVLKKHEMGLSYKIQIAATKRVFEGEALTKCGDGMVEVQGDGQYLYTVGLKETFGAAEILKQNLLKDGNKEAIVVAYVDGVRLISDNVIRQWSKKYPDLLKYLAGKGK